MNGLHGNMCPVPSTSYSSPGKETPILKNTTFNIETQCFDIVYRHRRSSYHDRYREIFGNFDIDVSSISVYTDIEVLDFDIDVSSISGYNDIDFLDFDIDVSSIS
jgi:hypothetical protein